MAKIITNEIAEKNVGKYIDCYNRKFGYYPMQIIKPNNSCMLKDRIDVCTPIEDSGFNSRYYDYMFEMIEELDNG